MEDPNESNHIIKHIINYKLDYRLNAKPVQTVNAKPDTLSTNKISHTICELQV